VVRITLLCFPLYSTFISGLSEPAILTELSLVCLAPIERFRCSLYDIQLLSRNPGTHKEVIRLGNEMVVLMLGPIGWI
jgi:hypothetical protein